jgi:hypothetical protein
LAEGRVAPPMTCLPRVATCEWCRVATPSADPTRGIHAIFRPVCAIDEATAEEGARGIAAVELAFFKFKNTDSGSTLGCLCAWLTLYPSSGKAFLAPRAAASGQLTHGLLITLRVPFVVRTVWARMHVLPSPLKYPEGKNYQGAGLERNASQG